MRSQLGWLSSALLLVALVMVTGSFTFKSEPAIGARIEKEWKATGQPLTELSAVPTVGPYKGMSGDAAYLLSLPPEQMVKASKVKRVDQIVFNLQTCTMYTEDGSESVLGGDGVLYCTNERISRQEALALLVTSGTGAPSA